MSDKIRVVFMGTPEFAVPSLRALVDAGFDVPAVVTQPDRRSGRGKELKPPPVKVAATELGIEVLQPAKIRDDFFIEKLRGLSADFFAVIAYGRILPKDILELPSKGCVNVHASLLPKYRGAAPINWAIANGERVTGVSTMLMDVGMDTGDVLLETRVEITAEDTAPELANRLSEAGALLLTETLEKLASGEIAPKPQDNSLATYAPILKKEDGRVDWSRSATEIHNRLRGLYPWPGAYTYLNGKMIKIHAGRAAENPGPVPLGGRPGTVVGVDGDAIRVLCGEGIFEITELQPENKKRMTAADFIPGYRVSEGDGFD